jgi:hypothetical protein
VNALETFRVSFLIISPFILNDAFAQLSSVVNYIQQFLVKLAFLKGSDIVIVLKPSSFSTIDLISYLDIYLESPLIKRVFASVSNP